MRVFAKNLFSTLLIVFFVQSLRAQDKDCMLGIGGSDSETIVQVFQLNEEQIEKLNEWKAELAVANKAYQEDIQLLFDTHPQSTARELDELATKYKVLKDQILENARVYDIRMLELFNTRQYERYLELCASARRTPYQVVPRTYPPKDR